MAMEIGKGICEGKEALIEILFMKLMENRIKERWKVTYLHEREIEGKLRENEENRDLNDKNASED